MFKRLLNILIFSLGGGFVLQAKPQVPSADVKIPKDLAIAYESFGRCHTKFDINSGGKLLMESLSCLPLFKPNFSRFESGKRRKNLSKNKIKELIAEIEKVNFFNLSDEYSTKKNSCATFVTDSGSTKISVRINGKTKQIFYENGCSNENDATLERLKNLGEKISQVQREVKIQMSKERKQ